MTQHRLDQPAPARTTLARVRKNLQENTDRWSNDADAQGFLREAEALIERDAAKPKE